MKKIFDTLFSTGFAGLYIIVFAIAIGAATFIENDYGTDTAQKLVYSAKWFEVLLLFFAIALVVNIFKYRLYRKGKWPIFLFHISILIIFFGSLITRYSGYEGVMSIREGSASNRILSHESYLQTSIFDGSQGLLFENKTLFGSWGKNKFTKTYRTPQSDIRVELVDFIPNVVEELQEDPEGDLIMELVVSAGDGQRRDIFLKNGETRLMGTYFLAFDSLEEANVVQFKYLNDSIYFRTDESVTSMQMGTMAGDTLAADVFHPFNVRTLYTFSGINLVMKSFTPKASLNLASASPKVVSGQQDALILKYTCGEEAKQVTVFGARSVEGRPEEFDLCGQRIFVAYGSKYRDLPFSLKLNDFQLERYPGSNSPSSYASEVTLLDGAKGVNKDHRIYMNHVLNYRGFRFFQSSYDPDEKGTVLSVNHDYWGTLISYLGYFLLALGMMLTLFTKNSRFVSLVRKVGGLSGKTAALIGMVFMTGLFPVTTSAQETKAFPFDSIPVIDEVHADSLSRILVQDFKGRIKPMHTLASEVLRKISRKKELYDQDPMQTLLSMAVFPDVWQDVPLIKLTHPKIGELIGNEGEEASFIEFFDEQGRYLLASELERSNQLKPIQRGTYEKELIKVDERLNICNYVFSSALLKIFPREDTTDTYWDSPLDIVQSPQEVQNNVFTEKFYTAYVQYVREAVST
ncbi:MAG: cytochrome C biogenesis protein, partial [Bacteroidetes bacterium]